MLDAAPKRFNQSEASARDAAPADLRRQCLPRLVQSVLQSVLQQLP
jgi:hypothetical protein